MKPSISILFFLAASFNYYLFSTVISNYQPPHSKNTSIGQLSDTIKKDSIIQKGCISGDCYTGTGIFVYNDGSVYEGGFLRGKKHGKGTYLLKNKKTQTGIWKRNIYAGTEEQIAQRKIQAKKDLQTLLAVVLVVGVVFLLIYALTADSKNSSNRSRSSSWSNSSSNSTSTVIIQDNNNHNRGASNDRPVNVVVQKEDVYTPSYVPSLNLGINNQTAFTFTHIYMSLHNESQWGEDILLKEFAPNEKGTISFSSQSKYYTWDLKLIDNKGNEHKIQNVVFNNNRSFAIQTNTNGQIVMMPTD